MVARPVEAIAGLPDGAARLFGRMRLAGERIVEAAGAPGQRPGERTAETSRRVGTAAITALGFEQERRNLAQRLGLPAPVDYVSWIEPLGRAVARPELQGPDKVAFLSGQLSPLARKKLAARGWRTDELYTIAAER